MKSHTQNQTTPKSSMDALASIPSEDSQLIVACTCMVLSTMAILTLTVVYFKCAKLRSYGFQIVLMLCLADLLYIVPNLTFYCTHLLDSGFKIGKDPFVCNLDGVLIVFAQQSLFFNAGLMIYVLYKIAYKEQSIPENSPLKFSLLTFGYPLVSSFM